MNDISIISVDASCASEQSTDIARVYADVFASPPWNEAFKCVSCGTSFGLEHEGASCCGSNIWEYYPVPETSAEIRKSFALNRARIALALAGGSDIVGFAWGWQDTLRELNDERFRLPDDGFGQLVRASRLNESEGVFYFSEFGVRADLRGRGVGREMLRRLFDSIDKENAKGIVMRTSKKSPAYSIVTDARNESIFDVSYEFRDALERVILSSHISS